MHDYNKLLEAQHRLFSTGKTRNIAFRTRQLHRLKDVIVKYEKEILYALKLDLNKSSFEGYETEIGIVLDEIKFTLKRLKSWSRPRQIKTPLVHFPSTSHIYSEPYGSVLIMSPWNYPFQLAIAPLIGSIAAGNCSVIKPSEYAIYTSLVMKKMLKETFPSSYVSVIEGDKTASQALLEEPFDYIFFTGSINIGKLVMKSAAKHLTPVTLELGGKSPCIVDETADIQLAAKRIIWGKYINSGQTCVAPDYLLVHHSIKEKLISAMEKYISKFYGNSPENNPDYPKMINQIHFDRMMDLMKDGRIISGGEYNKNTHQIAPVIMDEVSWESPVMQDEIFGPLLPVLEYKELSEVITQVNAHSKPLALYFFTTNKGNKNRIIKNIPFGGGCINDTIIHLANPHLPFGGVGNSGMGQYHGMNSFLTFSHQKSIIRKSNMVDIPLRYPPFKNHIRLLKKMMG
jgi:aldehyde dehydrogenase (NAD+)